MGTRSLTHFHDNDGTILATVYRQFDGYPEGHGNDLAAFIGNRVECNGMTSEDSAATSFNGPGCLAASLIAALKAESPVGGIYVQSPGASDCGEEFIYDVLPQGVGKPPHIKISSVYDDGKQIFLGTVAEFLAMLAAKPEDEG